MLPGPGLHILDIGVEQTKQKPEDNSDMRQNFSH